MNINPAQHYLSNKSRTETNKGYQIHTTHRYAEVYKPMTLVREIQLTSYFIIGETNVQSSFAYCIPLPVKRKTNLHCKSALWRRHICGCVWRLSVR